MPSIVNSDNGSVSGSAGLKYSSDGSGVLALQTNGTTAVTIDTSQAVTMAGRTTNPTTISVGGATPSTSGSGVSFPATQSASSDANTLDDYEEGTWTPTIVGSTTAGTASYTVAQGYYTKIGNRVFLQCYVNWSSGTGTGNLLIGNLPFTTSSSANSQCGLTIGYINNVALTASNYAFLLLQVTKTTVDVYQYPVGGGATNPVNYDSAGEIVISGHYFI